MQNKDYNKTSIEIKKKKIEGGQEREVTQIRLLQWNIASLKPELYEIIRKIQPNIFCF